MEDENLDFLEDLYMHDDYELYDPLDEDCPICGSSSEMRKHKDWYEYVCRNSGCNYKFANCPKCDKPSFGEKAEGTKIIRYCWYCKYEIDLCPKCGKLSFCEKAEDINYIYRCSNCGFEIVFCPKCGSQSIEYEYEYTCSNSECNYNFAICPKCNHLAKLRDIVVGEHRYKCTNKNFHKGRLDVFRPKALYRKEKKQEAMRLANHLKDNDKLTIREIVIKLTDSQSTTAEQSNKLKHPISTVGRWVKRRKYRKRKPSINDKLNKLKERSGGKQFFRCKVARAMESTYDEDISAMCLHCDRERVKRIGKLCILDLVCPKCHSSDYIFYGHSRDKVRLKCKNCDNVYIDKSFN